MSNDKALFDFARTENSSEGNAPDGAAVTPKERVPVELDMGEESREQGFRLNGCR